VLEALSNCKESFGADEQSKTKVGQALSLLDAHVYQKVNDYHMQVKSLLTFIRNAFQSIETRHLQHLAL